MVMSVLLRSPMMALPRGRPPIVFSAPARRASLPWSSSSPTPATSIRPVPQSSCRPIGCRRTSRSQYR